MLRLHRQLVLAALSLLLAQPALAKTWCHPIDNTARILASPSPNDIHRDWRDENHIGMSLALAPRRKVTAERVVYIEGDLFYHEAAL
ncbi:hypothetical protein ACFSQQ_01225 [Mesorhizobium kowhaii]|uniref:Uncharacterized protein n=1 Tax=Mesorhizobium calcicola TaxID=1300310 RepID=A0ABW4WBP7_9HYPH|nr:hypothetical protein [Mesorhizobium sophorae]